MKLGLILSNDWELFGDGSGDYWQVQRRPLQQLLQCVRDHGAKLTVMAEVGQQFAHRELGGLQSWARDIADDWEAALQDALCAGADVQMHLHPQWLNAAFVRGKWVLDRSRDALSSLPFEEIVEVLDRGKRYLEALLRPIDDAYRCTIFRAGAYCIEPSERIIGALAGVGFAADSSVVKGLVRQPFFDYRDAHSHVAPWETGIASVKYAAGDQNGRLIEMPVCSLPQARSPLLGRALRVCRSLLQRRASARWLEERRQVLKQKYSSQCRCLSRLLRRPWQLLWKNDLVQLDYDELSPDAFVNVLKRILADGRLRRAFPAGATLPVMAIGHAKTMHSSENLQRILHLIDRHLSGVVTFLSATEAVKALPEYRQHTLVAENASFLADNQTSVVASTRVRIAMPSDGQAAESDTRFVQTKRTSSPTTVTPRKISPG